MRRAHRRLDECTRRNFHQPPARPSDTPKRVRHVAACPRAETLTAKAPFTCDFWDGGFPALACGACILLGCNGCFSLRQSAQIVEFRRRVPDSCSQLPSERGLNRVAGYRAQRSRSSSPLLQFSSDQFPLSRMAPGRSSEAQPVLRLHGPACPSQLRPVCTS